MRIRILGTAAGGGLPQWNCACAGCQQARLTGECRLQDCLAVTGDGKAWYLLNASPDLRTQVVGTPELTPGPGVRETPLRGVLLTSAELDHTLGLLTLREGGQLTIYATAPVRQASPVGHLLNHYTQVCWRTVAGGASCTLEGELTATAVAVGSKRPRYAGDRPDADDWVVAYRIVDDRSGRVMVYAPCLAQWTEPFAAAVRDADLVMLDGTFYTADEMGRHTGAAVPAGHMGHLPITDCLPMLARYPGPRYLYTHLNNTNPVSRRGTLEHAAVHAAGAEVADDGAIIEL